MVTSAHALTAANDGLLSVDISGFPATNFVTAGTGTHSQDPETIEVDVSAGATVEQVYLYWARRGDDNAPTPSTIKVNGGVDIPGDVIGGPVDILPTAITLRANLTNVVNLNPGETNIITVQDQLTDPSESLGASVIIFYSLGGEESELLLFDGVDFLWANATDSNEDKEDALRNAEPITFMFNPEGVERTAELTLFIEDIEPEDALERDNSLRITVGDGDTPTLVLGSAAGQDPVFQAFQGAEWDNFILPITIPAGVDKVTVEPVSGPDGDDPASLVWSLAGLSVPVPEKGGGQGCTPGFWRQPHHFDSWTTYKPNDSIEDPFNIPGSLKLVRPENGNVKDLTLLEGVKLRGGDVNALIRHAIAALLNAANPDVSYDLSVAEVISKFNNAVDGGDIEGTKDEFEGFNELGCPLN